jgi:hypothetical protein
MLINMKIHVYYNAPQMLHMNIMVLAEHVMWLDVINVVIKYVISVKLICY